MGKQFTKSNLVDIVQTPMGDIIVESRKSRNDNGLEFQTHELSKGQKYLNEETMEILKQHNDILIKSNSHYFIDRNISELTTDYLFDKTKLEKLAQNYKKKKENKISLEESINSVKYDLQWIFFDELVKKSATNYLIYEIENSAPGDIIMDKSMRGFTILDIGCYSNCGFGTGNLSFYRIDKICEQENYEIFPRKTLEVTKISNVLARYLSPSSQTKEELIKLNKKGIIFEHNENLLYVETKTDIKTICDM
jgi:hypothetical protein